MVSNPLQNFGDPIFGSTSKFSKNSTAKSRKSFYLILFFTKRFNTIVNRKNTERKTNAQKSVEARADSLSRILRSAVRTYMYLQTEMY